MTDRPDSPPPVSAESTDAETGDMSGLAAAARDPHPAGQGWVQRLSSVLFVVFCFELGLFLLIYPWTDSWNQNYFSWLPTSQFHTVWHEFWKNTWFRGAVSGLGAANVWIAMTEVFRLFNRRRQRP